MSGSVDVSLVGWLGSSSPRKNNESCIVQLGSVFVMSCSHTKHHKIQKQTLGCLLPLSMILSTRSLWAQEKGKSFKGRKVRPSSRETPGKSSANALHQPTRQMMDLLPLVLWAMKGEKKAGGLKEHTSEKVLLVRLASTRTRERPAHRIFSRCFRALKI